MTTIKFETPTTSTTKAEEIAILNKLAVDLKGSGSYLEGLFSKQLVDWATNQIECDFTIDIANFYTTALEQHARDQKTFSEQLQEKKAFIEAQHNSIENLRRQLDYELERNEAQVKALHVAWEDISNRDTMITDANVELADRDQTIIELKARLWDLTAGK